ncbi:MAG: hypothetical protein HYY85_16580 [Deltaproteobacteria bacterium]|nr:hypothetical protein [Deltaproteobacteria bacterium]
MRRLIYVPVIHSAQDMGSKAGALKQAYVQQFGLDRWVRRRALIGEIWEGIRVRILSLGLRWDRVRVYQDGLPVSGVEVRIAGELAAQGSRNYQLILELLARGAQLEGTADPALLREEHALISAIIDAADEVTRERTTAQYVKEGSRILRERDAFISRRIQETLQEDEVGLLFMGMMHEVDRLLPAEIRVEYLIHRLPFREIPAGLGL